MKLVLSLCALFYLMAADAELTDLKVLNIDGIGLDRLTDVKNMEEVDWWVEMGEKLVVATNKNTFSDLPANVVVDSSLSNFKIEDLAFHVLGHCDHSETDEILHESLSVVISSQTTRIIYTGDVADKFHLLKHDSILPFEKNKVLTYQLKNRITDSQLQKNNHIQQLVDQVDQDRWYQQVEYLAKLDRYEDADLTIAGKWLEGKFSALDLVISRVSLNQFYRGFNVLGFKQGTIRADDWYVVGAHLDSRNQTRDVTLPSPGAEDNASGCSGVLEVANVISQYETEASIVFMCFIEEEQGLLGSKDVVTHFTNEGDIDKVKTMINMDMISYRNGSRNAAIAGTNDDEFQSLAESVAANGNLYTDIDWQVNLNMCCTDFVSFSAVDIPAVTSNQPDISSYFGYHSTQDLAVNLDPILGSGIVKANLVTLIDLVGVDFSSGDLIFANGFD